MAEGQGLTTKAGWWVGTQAGSSEPAWIGPETFACFLRSHSTAWGFTVAMGDATGHRAVTAGQKSGLSPAASHRDRCVLSSQHRDPRHTGRTVPTLPMAGHSTDSRDLTRLQGWHPPLTGPLTSPLTSPAGKGLGTYQCGVVRGLGPGVSFS